MSKARPIPESHTLIREKSPLIVTDEKQPLQVLFPSLDLSNLRFEKPDMASA
jgi:hypothetical protein